MLIRMRLINLIMVKYKKLKNEELFFENERALLKIENEYDFVIAGCYSFKILESTQNVYFNNLFINP